jgi:hypothetical protein
LAGSGKESGAIGTAAIGEDALDFDAMSGVEADGLVERIEHAGDFFVGQETGKSEAGVIIDGDVQRLDTGARITMGPIAGGADAGACEAAQLLDVEVEKLARMGVFIADGRRFGRFERREAVEMMAAQDTREGGLGDGQNHHHLGVGPALAAQLQDLSFELRGSLARLMVRDRRAVLQAQESRIPWRGRASGGRFSR